MSAPGAPPRTIDLNADMGEDDTRLRDGTDLAVLDSITSASIACGGHAGDEHTMRETARAAMARCVAIGAHPGYPDRANFGRIERTDMPDAEIEASVAGQVDALARIVRALGGTLAHVKPHGALYHAAMAREPVARAVARAVLALDPALILVGLAGAPMLDLWRSMGLRVAGEVFADRVYEPGGLLRSRTLPGAVITDPAAAAAQALRLVRAEGVITAAGAAIPVPRAQTLCLHGDTPGAPAIARAVRSSLEADGWTVAPMRAP